MGFQALAGAEKSLVHDAPGERPAPHDEALCNTVQDHIALLHAEIQQRFGSIVVSDKDRRLLGVSCKSQARMHPVIGGRDGLDRGTSAVPVVDISRSRSRERLLIRLGERIPFFGALERIREPQCVDDLCRRIGAPRGRRVVELVRMMRCQDREVSAHRGRSGLHEKVIGFRDERDPFDVAGSQAHERLPGIEFKIGLIAHKPPKAIDLIRAVRCNPNPRIEQARVR